MFITLFSLALLGLLTRFVLAQSDGTFTVYTPSLTQCQPANISWTDTGNYPYEVFIVPAENPCDSEALMYLGNQTSTSLTCTPDIGAGTQVDILVLDSTNNEAWSATITVGGSNDASCLASSASSTPTTSSGKSSFSGTPTHTSPTPSTTFAPAGAAGAGVVGASGALSTTPLGSVTLVGSAVLAAAVAFTL